LEKRCIQIHGLSFKSWQADSFDTILQRTGFESVATDQFRVPFLNRVYHIGFPELEFEDEADSLKAGKANKYRISNKEYRISKYGITFSLT
jgi:hypothetical protein